jgi:hypothetical protein
MKTAAASLIIACLVSPLLLAQGVPVVGRARVYATPSAASYPLQATVHVTLGVDLTGVTGQGAEGQTNAVLSQYNIVVTFDRTRLRFDGASGGTSFGFTGTPTFTSPSQANASGSITLTASQTTTAIPTGNIVVANLTFTAIAAGSATITASATSLSTAHQPAVFGPAPIPSDASSVTIALGSATVNEQTRYIPVVGATAGGFGSFFRTGLDLYNPTTASIQGRIVFHPAGRTGVASDQALAYSLGPKQATHYPDLVTTIGGSGLGSADLITADAFPVASAYIYNDAGDLGTSSLGEDVLNADEALQTGDTAALITPTDRSAFRFNIGVRTLDSGASLAITVRDPQGTVLATFTKTYASTFFEQVTDQQFSGLQLTGGETVSISVTAGSAIIYGATTDNKTQDPREQLARKIR